MIISESLSLLSVNASQQRHQQWHLSKVFPQCALLSATIDIFQRAFPSKARSSSARESRKQQPLLLQNHIVKAAAFSFRPPLVCRRRHWRVASNLLSALLQKSQLRCLAELRKIGVHDSTSLSLSSSLEHFELSYNTVDTIEYKLYFPSYTKDPLLKRQSLRKKSNTFGYIGYSCIHLNQQNQPDTAKYIQIQLQTLDTSN